MQKKALGILAAAAIAIGAAGFATSASAAVPAAGLNTVTTDAAKTDRNVQTVDYYRYYYYRPNRRCFFAGYRRIWHPYQGYVMKPVYRCHGAYYRPYYGRPYYGPRVRIRLGY